MDRPLRWGFAFYSYNMFKIAVKVNYNKLSSN